MARKPPPYNPEKGGRGRLGRTNKQIPVLKVLRAEQMMLALAQGKRNVDIAKEFNCTLKTIYNTIKWADENGIVAEMHNRAVLMGGKSLSAYEAILDLDPEKELTSSQLKTHALRMKAAKDITHGTGVLSKTPASSTKEEHTLDWYLSNRTKGIAAGTTPKVEIISADMVTEGIATKEPTPILDTISEGRLEAELDGGADPTSPGEDRIDAESADFEELD